MGPHLQPGQWEGRSRRDWRKQAQSHRARGEDARDREPEMCRRGTKGKHWSPASPAWCPAPVRQTPHRPVTNVPTDLWWNQKQDSGRRKVEKQREIKGAVLVLRKFTNLALGLGAAKAERKTVTIPPETQKINTEHQKTNMSTQFVHYRSHNTLDRPGTQ